MKTNGFSRTNSVAANGSTVFQQSFTPDKTPNTAKDVATLGVSAAKTPARGDGAQQNDRIAVATA